MGRIKNRQNLFDGFLFLENLLLSFQNTKSHQKPYGHGKNSHNNPRATDLRPYAVLAFSAALHPARDKVPRRTDFPLRRAPPYFLSTGRENVREPHSPWLFFAQMVKRHACGFFFVLFLSAKKKNRTLSLSQREENPLLFLSKAAPFLPSQTKKHKKRYFFHNRLLTFYPFHANIMT